MAISEVCQFELKEEVDKLKGQYPQLGLAECIRRIIQFYANAGVQVKEKTARQKYDRATKTLSTNVEPLPTPQEHNEIQENQEPRKHIATGEKPDGGAREGAGRKPKYLYTETFEVTHALDFAAMAITQLEKINKDDPLREEALDEVQTWINKNRRTIQ